MSAPAAGAAEPGRGGGGSRPALACDRHLARCSPLCDALSALDWRHPWVWFSDFGLLPLDHGRLLRLGASPPSGAMGHIKALTATLVAPDAGTVATQEFPFAPYAHADRSAAQAIVLCEQGGRFVFVRGAALIPLSAEERRCLARVCRAIEAWAALLSGGGLSQDGQPARGDRPESGEQEDFVVLDESREPSGAP
jgi:hypothetical protein